MGRVHITRKNHTCKLCPPQVLRIGIAEVNEPFQLVGDAATDIGLRGSSKDCLAMALTNALSAIGTRPVVG